MKIKKGNHPVKKQSSEFHDVFTPQFDVRNKKEKVFVNLL